GPTGAFIVIVYGIVEKHGVEGLTIATLMAGVLILLMGLLRLGKLLKYFPYTLIVGFTAGIAVIIFSAQVKDLLGLEMGAVPSGFVEKWAAYGAHLTSISPYAVAIGLGSVAVTFGFTRILPAVPGALVAIVLATLAAELFHLPVETIASRFGAIPSTFPAPTFPRVDMATLRG